MKTEELKKLSLEEQAKQMPEKKWGYAIFCGFFVILFIVGFVITTLDNDTSILSILGFFMFSYFTYACFKYSNDEEQEAIIKEAKKQVELIQQQKANLERASKQIAKMNLQYGDYDNMVMLRDGKDMADYIVVYGKSQILYIADKIINFKDIVTLSIQDEAKTKKGNITAVTETDNSSAIGRSLVGGALLGNTGAIIGASTATKTTTFTQEDDTIEHSFTAIVNVNDLSSPIISVSIGRDVNLANEINGIFNIIMKIKEQK